jgi:DNA-3-methyladenine glycosylase
MALLKPLPRKFYNRDTITVVKRLLGKLLVKSTSSHPIVAKIVETEACKGTDDPASHAYVGKTERNQLMLGKLGIVYVYLVYRNYHCFNATCERESVPGAVLVRSAEVLEELRIALKNRKTGSIKNLSNGPGKLTQALNISRVHNGTDPTKRGALFISAPKAKDDFEITVSERVGIKKGIDKPWRFCLEGC